MVREGRGPAGRDAHERLVQAVGGSPGDLDGPLALWSVVDGVRVGPGVSDVLPPMYVPISVEESISTREMWLQIDERESGHVPRSATGAAGTWCDRYAPGLVPVGADGTGRVLVVDLRAGPERGCVLELTPGDPFCSHAPLRPGLVEMIEDVTSGLRGEPVLVGHSRALARQGLPGSTHLLDLDDEGMIRWIFAPNGTAASSASVPADEDDAPRPACEGACDGARTRPRAEERPPERRGPGLASPTRPAPAAGPRQHGEEPRWP